MANAQNVAECSQQKRKRKVLSLESKLAILDTLSKGVSQANLAAQYGVGKSTISDIKKSEGKIRQYVAVLDNQGVSTSRKVMRLAKEDRLEEALYLWFLQKRSQGIAVNGPLLAKKAEELHKSMELPSEFKASSGWLWRFCRRHRIRELSLEGEKLSADDSGNEIFRNKLQDTMEQEGLTLEQLYNCDETGLQYRMLPDKTLACRHEKGAAGMKKQKDRVTLMACSNATGKHKLPLVCIGKSRNPRCFKNINKDALPVRYYAQRSAWMDCSIFTTWFQNEFVPSVKKYLRDNKLGYKALLLLDNAPSHPSSDVYEAVMATLWPCIYHRTLHL